MKRISVKKDVVAGLGALLSLVVYTNNSFAQQDALSDVKPIVDLRLRSESVQQDGMGDDASALTLRGRLGFETSVLSQTRLLAEGEFITPLESRYNDTINNKTAYPVVADPEAYEVNRLQLLNTSLPGTTLVVGRQSFALDDSRFISDSTWRQNEQTYDALRFVNRSLKNVTVDLSYLTQVNRSVGERSAVGRYQGDSYLTNISWQSPIGKASLFTYLLDFDEARKDSSRTTGIHLEGSKPIQTVKLTYSASYAHQQDYAANPLDYSVGYRGAEFTGAVRAYALTTGLEVLEGDGTKGFATPLGSNHKFAGWADKLGAAPPNGLVNRYASIAYTTKPIGPLKSLSLLTKYHEFGPERAGPQYGTELDMQLKAQMQKFTGMLKYADYHAQSFATDTRKIWMQIEYIY